MADLLLRTPLPYELKKKNRWILRFPSELGIQEWWLGSAARPSISQDEVVIPFLNTEAYVLGKYRWNPIAVTFRDPIGPSAAQALMEWVRLHSESVTGRQGYAAGYKKDIFIEMLDPTGVVVEKWQLVNTWLQGDINFGDLSYDSGDLADISASLRFDYAVLLF
jgi:hypothetical protein